MLTGFRSLEIRRSPIPLIVDTRIMWEVMRRHYLIYYVNRVPEIRNAVYCGSYHR